MHQRTSKLNECSGLLPVDILYSRYDPYSKEFTREHYDTKSMHNVRQEEIQKAAQGQVWGVVLGSLGRQGSPKVLQVKFYSIWYYDRHYQSPSRRLNNV